MLCALPSRKRMKWPPFASHLRAMDSAASWSVVVVRTTIARAFEEELF